MINRLTMLLILGITLTRASNLLGCVPSSSMPTTTTLQVTQAVCSSHCLKQDQQLSFYLPSTSTCACGSETDLPRDGDWSTSWSEGCSKWEVSVVQVETAGFTPIGKRRMESKKWLCDGSHRACRVSRQGSAYQCTDISRTADACGGCAHGEYLMSGTFQSPTGQDCTKVEGVVKGHSSCIDSQCVAEACQDGWELVHGLCFKL